MRRHCVTIGALLLLLSACSGGAADSSGSTAVTAPDATTSSAGTTTPTGGSVAPTTTPGPARTGPPPPAGTLDWYLYELPQFGPPPAVPADLALLPGSGPAAQVNQVRVGDRRVAFVTIDDGWLKDPDIVIILRAAHIPFTMFLTTDAVASDPAFFATLQGLGGVIEDHTITHPKLTEQSYEQQRREICENRAYLADHFGRAPTIVRAPYGLANANTLAAAGSCGIRANVFWTEYAVTGSVEYQRPGGIHPGDMVLMHFDKYLKANLLSTLQAFQRDGITPALLEDYLITAPPPPA